MKGGGSGDGKRGFDGGSRIRKLPCVSVSVGRREEK